MQNDEIKVLLADNRASNRRGLKALLSFEPRIVIVGEAGDGKEVLQLVVQKHPDLVLMDVQLPVMDGLKATKKIKSAWPGTKVVLYTIDPGYEAGAKQAGADYFLLKGTSGASPSEIILTLFP